MEPLSQLQENQAKSKVSLFDVRFMLQIVSQGYSICLRLTTEQIICRTKTSTEAEILSVIDKVVKHMVICSAMISFIDFL